MKDTIKFILFIIYTALIFCIQSYKLLIVVTIINIILMIIEKINILESIKSIIRLLPFICIIFVINAILVSGYNAILIAIRLVLVCNITYTFTKNFTANKLATSIENVLLPLKIFKVKTKDIGIMISIAVAFIPILKDETEKMKNSLKSKGFNTEGINMVKNINLILVPLIVSIFKRVDDMENAFKSKGYAEE